MTRECGPHPYRCDDGIGQFVCRNHSTSKNDPFHLVLYGPGSPSRQRERIARHLANDDLEWNIRSEEDHEDD